MSSSDQERWYVSITGSATLATWLFSCFILCLKKTTGLHCARLLPNSPYSTLPCEKPSCRGPPMVERECREHRARGNEWRRCSSPTIRDPRSALLLVQEVVWRPLATISTTIKYTTAAGNTVEEYFFSVSLPAITDALPSFKKYMFVCLFCFSHVLHS